MFIRSVELPGFQHGTCAAQGKRFSCCIWGIQKRTIKSGLAESMKLIFEFILIELLTFFFLT